MKRSGTRTQMGPGSGGEPYIDAVQFADGWLVVKLKRGLTEYPQRVHVICLFDDGDESVIHEEVQFPDEQKRAVARFEPGGDDGNIEFEPVVHVDGQPPQRTIAVAPEMTPAWIELRMLNASRSSQEFDRLSALIEEGDAGLKVTELDEDEQFTG